MKKYYCKRKNLLNYLINHLEKSENVCISGEIWKGSIKFSNLRIMRNVLKSGIVEKFGKQVIFECLKCKKYENVKNLNF